MASLPTLRSLEQRAVDPGWLWALRIATLAFTLPFCVFAILGASSWEERGPWLVLSWPPLIAYGVILWGLQSNPPNKLGLAVATAMGAIPGAVFLVGSLLSTHEALAALRKYSHWTESIWGALALVQAALLVSALGAFIKLQRKGRWARWVWAVRVLAAVSVLLMALPFSNYVQVFRQFGVAPWKNVLVLLAAMLVWVVVLWGVRARGLDSRTEARTALAVAIGASAVLFVCFGRLGWSAVYFTADPYERAFIPSGLYLLSFWALTLAEGGYAGTAVRVYYLMRREPGDLGKLVVGFVLVAVMGYVSLSAADRETWRRRSSPEAVAVRSLQVINTAEITYASTYGGSYSPALQALGAPPEGQSPHSLAANLIDDFLARGRKNSYEFTYTPGTPDPSGNITRYTLAARPLTYTRRSKRSYFSDESGVIRYTEEERGATAQDPPVP